jgi:hypothetical protein
MLQGIMIKNIPGAEIPGYVSVTRCDGNFKGKYL